ncbi:MAG: FtsW/RodA/SpoVE family cell cycle protein [Cytophagales bacterium]|nr:FtsW/RodA/SpoVE family cell cycle protein [Cytophagales bacterium]
MKTWMKHNLKGDPVIWGIVFILAIISILVVYSATSSLAYRQMQGDTEYYLIKHSLLVLISLFAMWVAHKIDYRYYAGLSKLALWIAVPLLLLTWKYGLRINEASRWITIPFINQAFQSSDLAQLALIVALANRLAKCQNNIEDFKASVVPMLIWCGVIGGLIALTNLSAAILLFLTCILLMYMGRVPIKYLATLTMVGIFVGGIAMHIGQRGETGWKRVKAFIQEGPSFQTEQAYIAIATGGLYGKGPGKSDQRSFLPHSYSDFIYAIIIEEYGLLGGTIVILLYLALLYRGMLNVSKSNCAFGGLLSAGLSFALVLQAMVNIGVAVGLGPITGLPLPFVSMGGTSLVFTGISLGIILSVSRGDRDEHSSWSHIPNNQPQNVYRTQQ